MSFYSELMKGFGASEKVINLLEESLLKKNGKIDLKSKFEFSEKIKRISFENVSFSYENRSDVDLLSEVNVIFESGKFFSVKNTKKRGKI